MARTTSKPAARKAVARKAAAADDHAAGTDSRYLIPILDRTLAMFELLATLPQGCGATEAADRLGIPKNTAFRILTTLTARGYVDRDPAEKTYRLSRKLLALGYSAVDEQHLVGRAIEHLRALRDDTDETALIATLVGRQGVVLEQVLSHQPVKFTVEIGHIFPLHTSAPGKAIVAFLPEAEREAMIRSLMYTRYNARTLTTQKAMRAECDAIRAQGYALDRGEQIEGVHCVGAPVLNHRGYPIAGVWITGPSYRIDEADSERIGAIVTRHAHTLSRQFGYQVLD